MEKKGIENYYMECKHSSSQNVKNYHFPFDSMKARMNAAISTKKKKNIHKKNVGTILKLNESRWI